MALVHGISLCNKNLHNVLQTAARNYCVLGPKSLGKKTKFEAVSQKEANELPVETDVQKLKNYVCGTNLYEAEGEDVKIRPDSEYPDWLWNLHIGKPKDLDELDPNTLEYWKRVRKLGIKQHYELMALRADKRDYK